MTYRQAPRRQWLEKVSLPSTPLQQAFPLRLHPLQLSGVNAAAICNAAAVAAYINEGFPPTRAQHLATLQKNASGTTTSTTTAGHLAIKEFTPWVNWPVKENMPVPHVRRRRVEESTCPCTEDVSITESTNPHACLGATVHDLRGRMDEDSDTPWKFTTFVTSFARRHRENRENLQNPSPTHSGAGPECTTTQTLKGRLASNGPRGVIDLVMRVYRARER